ncbi:glycosyltransferase family 2 protein [Neobacillus sp. M.A.Huq-85]|nr:glycosyltransferase [Neobacillus cucumis]
MISVIMPVYNAEKYLAQSIESILNQSVQDFEFIIINDGSTDTSEDIIRSFSSEKIKYFSQENAGAASARNKGIDYASGKFIVFQDADDLSLPNRFEVLLRQFTSPNIGIVHSDMLIMNENNSPEAYWQARNMENKRMLRFFLKVGTYINGASMMLRREVFNELRYDTTLKIGEDTNLILHALKTWDSLHVPEPLYFYRKHSTNTTLETDDDTVILHIQKTINEHSIEDLIPEIDWKNHKVDENLSKAFAILALLLYRREIEKEGLNWYQKSLQLARGTETENFVWAIGAIITRNLPVALQLLNSYEKKDHILENYIGETLALMGEKDLALIHFQNSLLQNPDYIEPIDNIRSLGALKSYKLLDITWMKLYSTK